MSGASEHSGPTARPARRSGFIGVFVRHPTAPNLLMAVMVLIGAFALARLNRQFFPTLDIPVITVTVLWPGASAEDAETNILDALEPELRFLDDVSEVTAIATEGSGVISIEFLPGADIQKAQADVEQAVARVTTLPEDSERPIITRSAFFDNVAKIAIHGPFSESVLKVYAKQLRDGLLDAGIDRVTLTGARDEEIWVRLREEELRRLKLPLSEVSRLVRENTRDLPAGKLEGENEVQLRAKSERKTPEAVGDIEVKSGRTGEKVFLKDIAAIETRFEREGKIGFMGGARAIELTVERSTSADTLATMRMMQDYIDSVRPTLPPTLAIDIYDVSGRLVLQRLGILVDNGLQGLVLVLAMLFIFLNARIAFWVAAGIPISLLAALGAMYLTGQSINMVSMFALIMMLGIIVDDAIVVGEEAATLEERGLSPPAAAEQGAVTMLAPVLAATLTTISAFLPILFVGDRIGQILAAIPLVVISVLIASTIECFLILPGHLRHGSPGPRRVSRFRQTFERAFGSFRDGPFRSLVAATYAWRYTTLATMVASLILAIGMVSGGRVGFEFFPSPESENLTASMVFGAGTPRDRQAEAAREIEQALYKAEQLLVNGGKENRSPAGAAAPRDGERLVLDVFTLLGKAGRSQGDNLAEIDVQLTPSEERRIATRFVIAKWYETLPSIPGVERVAIAGRRGGPPGRDVDVRLQNGTPEVLKQAAEELKEALTGFPGVSGIDDDLPYGKLEYVFELTPRGSSLGFTGASVGLQVRNAFEGAIATRFARGDEEITVRVLRDQQLAGRGDLEHFYLTSPRGDLVPLTEIVSITERRTFSVVQRRDGVRTVAVTADVDSEVTTSQAVLGRLASEVLPPIMEKYGLKYVFKGRADETQKSFKDLGLGTALALSLIYIVLAWVFASYWKPLTVMAIIPFGLAGAIYGHYLMGYNLTIISMIGLLGLSGILVNDSIVLVTRIKERLAAGNTVEVAAIGAARDRLRAVLLTSLTTIGGLAPLMFETSRQAQFLIPMAVTLVFGLAISTVLVLILVPSLIGIGSDMGQLSRTAWRTWRNSPLVSRT